jgi:hypothetical protein
MSALMSEIESNGWRRPDFGNSNLAISKQLAGSDKGSLIGCGAKKLFIIIDGMGYKLARRVVGEGGSASEHARWLNMRQITSIFPSTTGNVLSSFYSGMTTARHGIVGTKVPFKEAGMLINVLGFSAALGRDLKLWRIDPKTFYPKPEMIDSLKARGGFKSLLKEDIIGTGLSTAVFEYGDVVPFVTFEDMLIRVKGLIKGGTRYIFAYYDVLDHVQHAYGPDTEEAESLLHGIFSAMDRILRPVAENSGYDLIITSDHGQTSVPEKNAIEIESDSGMLEFLQVPPWGEGRSLFLHVSDGKERAFEDYFHRHLAKHAMLVDSDEAIRCGLFGDSEVGDLVRYRFGTHIIMPYDNFAMPYKYPNTSRHIREKPPMLGMHGGLTEDEMLIPLFTNF